MSEARRGKQKKTLRPRKSAGSGYLVTNHQNMLFMLAAGMVMGPAGFRGKHYSDSLSNYLGWIPLFLESKISTDALTQAVSERTHLRSCIAAFDLGELSSPVRLLSMDGKMREVTSPASRKGKNDIAILMPAPLPLSLLASIHFASVEDKQAFESAAKSVANVDPCSYSLEVTETLFSRDVAVTWPPTRPQRELIQSSSDAPPAWGQALGGVLAMLYHLANRSELGRATFLVAAAAGTDADTDMIKVDPLLTELPGWLQGGRISAQADPRAQLYWGVIQALIAARKDSRASPPVEVAIDYLDGQLARLEEKFRAPLERLLIDMRNCFGVGGGTVTELFERHKGSLSRPLLLFCLRERCTDFLEYSHPLLKDAEYILAGILFGVRDSWLQLPLALRDPALSTYVMYRMADAECRAQGSGVDFKVPPRPRPLREIFTPENGEWSARQRSEALELARTCLWHDCVRTIITLPEGDHPESFQRTGLQLVLPGAVKAVTEVDVEPFLGHLGDWPPVAPPLQSELRKRLENGGAALCG